MGIEIPGKEARMNYEKLFQEHGIPTCDQTNSKKERAERILMISTHGHWGDPPPAGVPDTGGQTHYVLKVSKAWADQGRKVIILARHFGDAPHVETFAKDCWLIRIPAGSNAFVRKEEIYSLTPLLAEEAVQIGKLFGAQAVVGHYADGMTVSAEVAEQMNIPLACIPHSLSVLKMKNLGLNPVDSKDLRDAEYNFWTRESLELASLRAADLEMANTPLEPVALKEHYDFEQRHEILPAGADATFFAEYEKASSPDLLKEFGLTEGKFLISWGRFSAAKNVPGVVKVFGELKKLGALAQDFKLLVIGGSSEEKATAEEKAILHEIANVKKNYGLGDQDVLRTESASHDRIAKLAHCAFAYVGMQFLEPFGMAPAEAMAVGIPAFISSRAGIVDWLSDQKNAVLIDPENPASGAKKLAYYIERPDEYKALATAGQTLAVKDFSWPGIAKRQGELIDGLLGTKLHPHGFHRTVPAWRGDYPKIRDVHEKATEQLRKKLSEKLKVDSNASTREIIVLSGESGSGKTEIAHLLTLALRQDRVFGVVVPGDAFFKLAPDKNHAQRVQADKNGELSSVIGPHEVDLSRLDAVLAQAKDRKNKVVYVPSECRSVPGRRYESVPLDLSNADVVFVDLTYGFLLENVDTRIFLEQSSLKQIDVVRARNLERDPNQDFGFIQRVLELEHQMIAPMQEQADLIVDVDYTVRSAT